MSYQRKTSSKDSRNILELKTEYIKRKTSPRHTFIMLQKNKNKENGIWLYEVAFWNSEEFERHSTWEDILYWKHIEEPKD